MSARINTIADAQRFALQAAERSGIEDRAADRMLDAAREAQRDDLADDELPERWDGQS